ncbi:hypothetical protein SNE40_015433 [Patella caerulea]|uniref:Uncharacterized protein n=1 Tax=Patella caerulea TaxID=87958 RepID=A0AAN8JGX9_PATCE
MYDSVYIADLTVYCTFKGSVLPTRINVSDAGFVPGLCHSTNLTTGKEYVVFLSQQDNKYTPTYKEDLPNDQYLEEIGLLCEHDINYPQGLDESTATMMCPDNYPDYPDCIRYTEPEPDTEPEVKPLDKNTPIVEVTKPGEVSGDGGKEINDGGNGGSGVMNVTCLLAYICVFVSLWL